MSRSGGGTHRRAVREADAARSVDAAALQSDMARRFNLPGAAVKRVRYLMATSTNTGGGPESSRQRPRHEPCLSCGCVVIPTESSTCPSCGVFFRSMREVLPTLAEMRGLVKAPTPAEVTVLTREEWAGMEQRIFERKDAVCPICMEHFKDGHEVLLSCSHMYHRNCLSSFEKFSKSADRFCPVCRSCNYQKKVTHVGSRCFQIQCTIRLQALWRGHRARAAFYLMLRDYYHQGFGLKHLRQQFYEKELQDFSSRISRDVDVMSSEVSSMLQSSDAILREGRELDDLFNEMLAQRLSGLDENGDGAGGSSQQATAQRPTEATAQSIFAFDKALDTTGSAGIDWKDVLARAASREDNDCAVCMCSISLRPVKRQSKSDPPLDLRPIALLSCSHVFHDKCIASFELYRKEDIPQCPMCRCAYEKAVLRYSRVV